MCSVVGYIGARSSSEPIFEGLTRLEYRGYDSAGFACLTARDGRLSCVKTQGSMQALRAKLAEHPVDGHIGIGHTRWSTHGAPTEENAHPLFDCQKTISVVHNGIIENHLELRRSLESRGHFFVSETDTESVAHLLEESIAGATSLANALVLVIAQLRGAYAFVALFEQYPDCIAAVRRHSPLCIGYGDGEMLVASDPLAFAQRTARVAYLPDETFALVFKDRVEFYDCMGRRIDVPFVEVDFAWSFEGKGRHEHFMLKEIYEQKKVLIDTIIAAKNSTDRFWQQTGIDYDTVRTASTLNLIGCGSSYHAALIGEQYAESIARFSSTSLLASEFRYRPIARAFEGFSIAISQSGETADTLEAVRLLAQKKVPAYALTNVPSSTLVREADGFVLTQAKQEIAVASTKSFTAQVATLFWLSNLFARTRGLIDDAALTRSLDDLLVAAEVLENSIEEYRDRIRDHLAPRYAQHPHFIFLGRGLSYVVALEAALKLREIAYKFVECYPAGELKHGPIALLEQGVPVMLFSVLDPIVYSKLVSNAQEVKARGAWLTVFAFEGQDELIGLADEAIIIPRVNPHLIPIALIGVAQYCAYEVARALQLPIDKPRNLAKSVTVE